MMLFNVHDEFMNKDNRDRGKLLARCWRINHVQPKTAKFTCLVYSETGLFHLHESLSFTEGTRDIVIKKKLFLARSKRSFTTPP